VGWGSLAYLVRAVRDQIQSCQGSRRSPPGGCGWLGVEEHRSELRAEDRCLAALLLGFPLCSRLCCMLLAKVRDLEHMLKVNLD